MGAKLRTASFDDERRESCLVAVEVVSGILIAGLAITTVLMAVLGGSGLLGIVRTRRCPACGRLSLGTSARLMCAECRHPALCHPIRSLHHDTGHG